MNIKKNQLYMFSFLFSTILIYSYYYLLKGIEEKVMKQMWGGIDGNVKKVYLYSMLLCIASMLFIFKKIYESNLSNYNNYFIAMLLILLPSIMWTPLSLQYLNNRSNTIKYSILLVLLLVSIGSYLLYQENKNIGSKYFTFHVFCLDFIYWSYRFFNYNN